MQTVEKKKVAVVGSRSFKDKARLYDVLTKNFERIKLIVSGGAEGADSLAVEWAKDFGIPYLVFPALWRDPFTGVFNKGAGFKRNRNIVEQADVVIAFWDGVSGGTKNTIEISQQVGKPVKIINFSTPPAPTTPPMFGVRGIQKVAVESTPLQIWFKGIDGLCCSSPICEHQEWPDKIEAELRKLVLIDNEATLVKTCGVPIEKIRPVLEVIEKILHKEDMDAEARLGERPEGCSDHCCTPEAMQARHDFYEAQEQSFREAAEAPVEKPKEPEIPFKDDIL